MKVFGMIFIILGIIQMFFLPLSGLIFIAADAILVSLTKNK